MRRLLSLVVVAVLAGAGASALAFAQGGSTTNPYTVPESQAHNHSKWYSLCGHCLSYEL